MTALNKDLELHYLKEDLLEDILKRLQEMGISPGRIRRQDIAGVDEFHVRGAAVSRELAASTDLMGKEVLDVGCGLGGPCRMLADEYGCQVTGIDLSGEYIRTAAGLSRLVGMSDTTRFVQGDAAHLPFDDHSFDVVWTQHVQMNIPDKARFYAEIDRVLKPGGTFLCYEILKASDAEITYPMPWAGHAGLSHLMTASDMENHLEALGFRTIQTTDQTRAGMEFFERMLVKLAASGPPKMGLNVLMGASTKPKLLNLLNHLRAGDLVLLSGIFEK